MKLGDLLIAAGLVTTAQVNDALARQLCNGLRLGENLVAGRAITQEALDAFLHRVPLEPKSIAATGIDEAVLLGLMLKLAYIGRIETIPQLVDAIRLPPHIVSDLVTMAVERRLLCSLGSRDGTMFYALTEEGRGRAQEALQQSQYAGPAPVSLEQFTDRVELQKINNVVVSLAMIRDAFSELTVTETFIEKIGPALNSDRAILLYGPSGNGKTSVARCLANLFSDVVYIPHAVMVGGHVMRVYDPSVHVRLAAPATAASGSSLLRPEELDGRWVPCRRPFIVTGGELTLEMLDLQFNATANFYEAPLHVKALGGCLVIDDFGRQLVAPAALLNRWIVPMESRVDYMKLHTGKSFAIPFEELLIFSTNLEPEELMDPAFLRRLPYKLEVGAPDRALFRRIFDRVCEPHALVLTDAVFDDIVMKIVEGKEMALAAYQPKFIVEQVVAACRFMGQPPHFDARFIDYAVDNLRVARKKR